ncbi:MAG: hypothetical protein Q9213_005027 [Squamulea squamosa]
MKERITFIHARNIDPNANYRVSKKKVQIKALKAAREQRLTLSLQELPQEKALGFDKSYAFDENALIEIPVSSSRHHSLPRYHYYGVLRSLNEFVIYVQEKVCAKRDLECSKAARSLEMAAYLHIDYDAQSQDLILTSFHHESPESAGWNEQIKRCHNSARTEVGIFASQEVTEPEELSLGGFLTVIGEDEKPKPTRFSFPSRHHPVPHASGSTFLTTFPRPTGLHPTLRLSFPSAVSPPAQACGLHTYLTLPSSLFVDKYQLSSPNFLASKNLRAIRALSGEADLEAPDWVTRKWGSTLLLDLAPHALDEARSKIGDTQWHVDIPLHLRYLPPTAGGISSIDVPWPVVFWACPTEEESGLGGNPFDRVNLGYEALFNPDTIFYHFQPQPKEEGGRLIEQVQVPVMDLQESRWVESGTVGIILLGALWVMWKLMRVTLRAWQSKETLQEKKKKIS